MARCEIFWARELSPWKRTLTGMWLDWQLRLTAGTHCCEVSLNRGTRVAQSMIQSSVLLRMNQAFARSRLSIGELSSFVCKVGEYSSAIGQHSYNQGGDSHARAG